MTAEEFVDEILVPWANEDDRVVLVEPTLESLNESWEITFTDGAKLHITIEERAQG